MEPVRLRCKPLHLRVVNEEILGDEALFKGLLALRRELNELYRQRGQLELEIERGEILFEMRQDLLIGGLKPNRALVLAEVVDGFEAAITVSGFAGFALDGIIKHALVMALRKANGNRSRVAKLLGVSRMRVYRLIEHYGLESAAP